MEYGEDIMISLNFNGETHAVDVDSATPLLWLIRDHVGLTGTRFGCGIAQCGAYPRIHELPVRRHDPSKSDYPETYVA